MRLLVSNVKRVHPGDLVRVHLALPQGSELGRFGVWSSHNGEDYSPHIQVSKLEAVSSKPTMHTPMFGSLRGAGAKRDFEFVAEEKLYFKVLQDADLKGDTKLKARIRRRSVLMQKILAKLANIFGDKAKEQGEIANV